MRIAYLACGSAAHLPARADLDALAAPAATVTIHQLDARPHRKELRFLDELAHEVLPHDPTPSLDEIAQRPDVSHLGEPGPPPQSPEEELRVVVAGDDAALSAVLTRMMRGDYLWAPVGYVPTDPTSAAATNWSLPGARPGQLALALRGRPQPVPVIRNDQGVVVAGVATVTHSDGGAFEGEIIVDDTTLVQQQIRPANVRFFSQFGARLVPTIGAPGIAALRIMTPPAGSGSGSSRRGLRARLSDRVVDSIGPQQAQSFYETPALRWLVSAAEAPTGGVDPRTTTYGRALQAGGNRMLVTVDGVEAKRPVDRVTFYRHLRDLQIARPA